MKVLVKATCSRVTTLCPPVVLLRSHPITWASDGDHKWPFHRTLHGHRPLLSSYGNPPGEMLIGRLCSACRQEVAAESNSTEMDQRILSHTLISEVKGPGRHARGWRDPAGRPTRPWVEGPSWPSDTPVSGEPRPAEEPVGGGTWPVNVPMGGLTEPAHSWVERWLDKTK